MTLPKKPLKEIKSERGQILILFLLILVVGLAIVLSIASRTVTDIRTTTTSDESNRAYFAAEAGVEEALRQLGLDPSFDEDLSLDFSALNQSGAEVTIAAGAAATRFVYPEVIAKDDVAQLVLLNNWTAYDLSNTGWAGTLRIYWGATDVLTEAPAVEISVIYATRVGVNWFIQQDDISKVVFDPNSAGRPSPFACAVTTESNLDLDGTGKNFNYRAEFDIDGASEGCTSLDSNSDKPVLARIRLLYQSSPIAVESVAGGNLPAQGDVVVSSGTTDSGVTRKLQVTRLYPAVDPLFDYVLFSGSTSGCGPTNTDPCPLEK